MLSVLSQGDFSENSKNISNKITDKPDKSKTGANMSGLSGLPQGYFSGNSKNRAIIVTDKPDRFKIEPNMSDLSGTSLLLL